jgi:hypothetical protein
MILPGRMGRASLPDDRQALNAIGPCRHPLVAIDCHVGWHQALGCGRWLLPSETGVALRIGGASADRVEGQGGPGESGTPGYQVTGKGQGVALLAGGGGRRELTAQAWTRPVRYAKCLAKASWVSIDARGWTRHL